MECPFKISFTVSNLICLYSVTTSTRTHRQVANTATAILISLQSSSYSHNLTKLIVVNVQVNEQKVMKTWNKKGDIVFQKLTGPIISLLGGLMDEVGE